MQNDEAGCQAPRCHADWEVEVLGLRLCDRHWHQRCEREEDERTATYRAAEPVARSARFSHRGELP